MTWRKKAACSGLGPSFFVIDSIGAAYTLAVKQAKSVCAGCPVSNECLQYALHADWEGEELKGVWGGTTEVERRKLRERTAA